MTTQPELDTAARPRRKKLVQRTTYTGAALAACLAAIWWLGATSSEGPAGSPGFHRAAGLGARATATRPAGWNGAWDDDYSTAFDRPADAEEAGPDAAASRQPVRNINRLFMVLRPEDGMGPPPGARAGR